jgi:endonuclease/exonuclease/phosphatase (EEP) superfamily protein YafD
MVLAGVALTTIAAVLLHTGADQTMIGTLLLFAPRHGVPLGWLLLAVALVFRHRRLAVVAIGTSIGSLLLLAGFVPPRPSARTTAGSLRVVSWNVDYPESLGPQLGSALARWQADVILLQGCTEPVADELHRHRASAGHVWRLGEFCILSQLPVLGVGQLTARNPKHPQWPRPIAVHLHTVVNADTIELLSVHLSSPRTELGRALHGDVSQLVQAGATRAEQSALLADHARTRRWPMLLIGDFNTPPGSVIYQRHFSSLTNAFHAQGWGFGHTMRAGWLHRLRIDHALVTEELEVVGFTTETHWPTEHVPLIVDLRRR